MNRALLTLGFLCVLCALVFSVGCGTPRGYQDDLTPGDGSAYIGALNTAPPASPCEYSAPTRAAMRAHLAAHPWCAWCGAKTGLQVHHICPVSRNPDLAAEPLNLMTLCVECHWVLGHKRDWRKAVWNLRTVVETALEMGPPGDEP